MEPWLETFARANFRRSADTAHDLKTPLNVAVLNLELLRIRLRKIAGDDEKIDGYSAAITGSPATEGLELTKLFKLYYTDPQGNADLSLAVARLIAETYGGELNASEDRDKVTLRFTFPLGER